MFKLQWNHLYNETLLILTMLDTLYLGGQNTGTAVFTFVSKYH